MKCKGRLVFLLLIVVFLGFAIAYAWEINEESTVTEVIDGDSLRVCVHVFHNGYKMIIS